MGLFEGFLRTTIAAVLPAVLAASLAPPDARAWDSACTADPRTEVITREDLVRYAVSRLSDVFTFSTNWHASSLDGYHWQATPAGLAPDNERWAVYVDGVPVSTRLLGRNQLNALPIPVFYIECIELAAGPDLRQTTFSRSGSIHIHTRAPDFGLSLEGGASMGSEINDPGPFRYTETGGPNVDRIGPIWTAGASVNSATGMGRATVSVDEFHFTDATIIDRLKHYYDIDSKPRINTSSIGLTGSVGPVDQRQGILLGSSKTEDLAFFTPVGLEIPTEHRFEVVGGAGRLTFPGGGIRYAASYVRGDLVRRWRVLDVDLDWRQDQFTVEAEARLHGMRVGGGVRATEAHSAHRLSDPRVLTTRLFAGMGLEVSPGWHQDLVLEWKQHGEFPTGAGYASADVHVARNHRLTLTGSYGHVLRDDHDLWMWIGRGYALPTADSIDLIPRQAEPLPRLVTVDASWIGDVANALQVSIRSFYRNAEHDYIPIYDVAYVPETFGFDVITGIRDDVAGSTAGAGITLDLAHGQSFHHRFTYVARAVLTGDRAYRDRHARIPSQRITYSATFAPVDRFSLSTLVRYTAATTWPNFERASGETDGTHPWMLPEYFLVDVSASKLLWKDHVVLSLALKNVLDQPVRFHPAGAIFHMALHFSAQVNFTSIAGF